MKVGILSDTHGRVGTAARALDELRRRGVNTVIHCGDIDEPATVAAFRGFEAHFVFGNCDADRDGIRRAVAQAGGRLHDEFGNLELEGVRIAFLHGHDAGLMHDLANSGAFDFLFYGHTHVPAEYQVGSTRVINPGALHRARVKTFIVLDLATREVESVVVDA
jgi:putative phosphoesterase